MVDLPNVEEEYLVPSVADNIPLDLPKGFLNGEHGT